MKFIFKQEALLRSALQARGLDDQKLAIEVDHYEGKSYVNGTEFGLIYPDSFFTFGHKLHLMPKSYQFYFNGNMDIDGGREKMLTPFTLRQDSRVVKSNIGRINLLKGRINPLYFVALARSVYGLCPHQLNWTGTKLWTYRFVDCLLVGTIPVIFRESPLDDEFMLGFEYEWNDDGLKGILPKTKNDTRRHRNFAKAQEKFRLPQNFQP